MPIFFSRSPSSGTAAATVVNAVRAPAESLILVASICAATQPYTLRPTANSVKSPANTPRLVRPSHFSNKLESGIVSVKSTINPDASTIFLIFFLSRTVSRLWNSPSAVPKDVKDSPKVSKELLPVMNWEIASKKPTFPIDPIAELRFDNP